MFIYVIVNSETLKLYVGQHKGQNLRKYLQTKISDATHQVHLRSRLYASMRKHPKECWSIHPLVSGIETRAELDDLERHYIKVLKCQYPDIGYNICDGGEGFTGPHTDAAKEKLRLAMKGRKPVWSQLQTPEARQKRSATLIAIGCRPPVGSHRGFKHSAETKARWSVKRKGIVLSEEHRQKIADGLKRAYAEGRR